MALKPDRKILDGTDISFFMNTVTERGGVVVLSAGGSGCAMDDASAVAAKPTAAYASGQYVLGILMNDVVSGDLTKFHLNSQKDEVQVGGKVTILRRGTVLTNMLDSSVTPGQGAFAGASSDGKMIGLSIGSTTLASQHSGLEPTNPQFTRIGTWLSYKDSDGYAKLDVNLI